jgi:hypothetical protein
MAEQRRDPRLARGELEDVPIPEVRPVSMTIRIQPDGRITLNASTNRKHVLITMLEEAIKIVQQAK